MEIQHLMSLIHDVEYFCWLRIKEESDVVGDTFWIQPDSVKLMNMFYQVLISLVGFAYLKHEKEVNFK